MPGTKIINVLKDDSFKEILDLFRKTDAEDVVFVLPKRSSVFKREDHFAAFASEARRTGKQVSIMCSNPAVNTWAQKYEFAVIAKGGTKPKATLTAALSDEDEEARDPNRDAFDSDVAGTTDETMGVTDEDAQDEEDGMHVEDEDSVDQSDDDTEDSVNTASDEPSEEDELDDEGNNFDQVMKQYGPNDMELYDEEGNLIRSGSNGATATLAVSRSLDGVRSSAGKKVGVKSRAERTVKVGITAQPQEEVDDDIAEEEIEEIEETQETPRRTPSRRRNTVDDLDYIDAVWRDTVGDDESVEPAKKGSRWSKLFASPGRKKEKVRVRGWRTTHKRRTAVTVAIIAVGIIGGAFLVFGMGKASVQVVPVSRDLEFELSVQSSDAFGEVDPLFNKIPGQLFEIERTVEREFSTSGSQEVAAKAKGTITVSNAFSDTDQTLIATTRFEDEMGHIFRTLRTVTVPGASGGVAGSVGVEVIADKPGADFNIAPTAFTIPAFKEQGLSERFAKITGTSDKAFVGGALGLSGIVTQEDLDDAKTKVSEELQVMVRDAFDAQAVDLELINAAQVQVMDLETSADVEQAVDTFTVSARGVLSTVGYRTEDLFVLLEEHAQRNWQLTVLPEQTELHFDEIKFVEDRGILSFSVTALARGYADVNTDQIISDIRGNDRQTVREYFRNAENVRSSTVLLSPIWVRSVPDNAGKIELEVLYEAPTDQ